MKYAALLNAFLRPKGNIIRVKFEVDGRIFEALVPDDQLWIAIKDVLLNREYEYLPGFELHNFKGLVVDAGAHVGLFTLTASRYASRVVAIEAHPINYKLLEVNVTMNRCNNVITLNKALTGKPMGRARIYEGTHTGGHTIMPRGSAQASSIVYGVPTITLGEVISKYGPIDLLKIDVEGAEFEVFKHAKEEELRKIRAIVGEIHLDHGDVEMIAEKLESAGFKVDYYHPPLAKKEGRRLKVHGLHKLKLLKSIAYTLATIAGVKERSLAILFASRKVNQGT